MSLHIYPKQSRIPLLVHGSIISSLVVHGPGSRVSISSLHQEPSRANIRDHLEPTSGTISSQHLGPSRANIWDHLEPTSGTISSQHLGSHHLIWVVHGPGKIWGLTSFTWSCPRPRCDEKIHCFPLLITMRLNKFYLVLPQTKVPPLHHSSRPRCDEKLMLSRLSVLSVQLTLG